MNNSASEGLPNFDQCPERQWVKMNLEIWLTSPIPVQHSKQTIFAAPDSLAWIFQEHNFVRHPRAIKTISVFTLETDLRWNMRGFLLVSQLLTLLLNPWSLKKKKFNFRTSAAQMSYELQFVPCPLQVPVLSWKTPRSKVMLCINRVSCAPLPLLPLVFKT